MTTNCRSRPFLFLVTLSIVLFADKTRAEPPSTEAVKAGVGADDEGLISRGLELREKGDDEAALGSFRKAYDLSKSGRALAQVALAEQALGRWVDAEAHLGQAVLRADDPWIARNKQLLDQALTEIQGHLGSLELSGGVVGAEVILNGTPAGAFPLKGPIRVAAGSVALEVRAVGHLPVARTVTVPGGGLARESVVLVATAPAAPARPVTPMANDVVLTTVGAEGNAGARSSGSWTARRKAAVALGAAAVVGLGVGTTFLLIGEGHVTDFKNADCTLADQVQPQKCQSLIDDTHAARTVGVVGLVGAALLASAGAYLFFTDRSGEQTGVALARRGFNFRCLPSVSAGVACAGEF